MINFIMSCHLTVKKLNQHNSCTVTFSARDKFKTNLSVPTISLKLVVLVDFNLGEFSIRINQMVRAFVQFLVHLNKWNKVFFGHGKSVMHLWASIVDSN